MRAYPHPALLAFLIAFGGLVPAFAQENVAPAPTDPQEVTEMDAVARWQADPTTIFDAREVDLDAFRWVARPLVVFGDAPQMPDVIDQLEKIRDDMAELVRRDVVVVVDTQPEPMSEVRRKLRPRGFQLTLLGKDGGVKLRKPFPWHVREIGRSIDKMPMRQREIHGGG